MAYQVPPDGNMYKTFNYLFQPLSQSVSVLAQVTAFCLIVFKSSLCYFRAVCGDLVTLCSKYTVVGYYYFFAWFNFGVEFVAMKYFPSHSAIPYRVTLREHENVQGQE
jgi:hypothetical protein